MRVFLALMVLVAVQPIAAEQGSAVATLIHKEGVVEVRRNGAWQELLPLQPLYDGDEIRIRGGIAVLTHLGFAAQTLRESDSPYTIREKKVGQGRSKKALAKLNKIFSGMVHGPEEKGVMLATRGSPQVAGDTFRSLVPDRTPILFPSAGVTFRWQGATPPYLLRIFKGGPGEKKQAIGEFERQMNGADLPADLFADQTLYHWEVISGALKGSASFQVLGKEESAAILLELNGILRELPGDDELTRYLVSYGFFIENGLRFDAQRVREEALKKYPENAALLRLDRDR